MRFGLSGETDPVMDADAEPSFSGNSLNTASAHSERTAEQTDLVARRLCDTAQARALDAMREGQTPPHQRADRLLQQDAKLLTGAGIAGPQNKARPRMTSRVTA